MFRYLNDSPRLRLTILLAAAESLLVGIMLLTGGKVSWVCHNVDRETRQHYPRVTRFRRRVIGGFSTRVFVTDPLLQEQASKILPRRWARKLTWTCFGSFDSWGALETWGHATEPPVKEQVEAFVSRMRVEARKAGKRCLIGLCLGRAGDKYLHFQHAGSLLKAAEETDFTIGMIIALDVSQVSDSTQVNAIQMLQSMSNVLLFDRTVGFHEGESATLYDFFWRGYDDWSTPITVYGAASVGKPILALDSGFLSMLVKKYCLGAVVPLGMDGLKDTLEAIQGWQADGSRAFLDERGWDVGANQIVNELLAK